MTVAGAPPISIESVSKVFRRRGRTVEALRDVDLRVTAGEFVSLLGPSGCGKSTLLRIIGGLQPVDNGDVSIGGTTPDRARQEQRFGLVPQAPALVPWKTVGHNVRFLSKLHRGAHAPLPDADVDGLIEAVGLSQFTKAYPHELSGGMQQRVSLVRAFALGAPILLMDEPFAALDEITRADMRYLLLDLWQRTGTTVVFVTHSVTEAVILSDRVVVMAARPGRIAMERTVALPRPRTPGMEDDAAFHEQVRVLRADLRGRSRGMTETLSAPVDQQVDPIRDLGHPPIERKWRSVWMGFAPVIGVLVPLLAWQAYVQIADVKQVVLPAPWDVIQGIWDDLSFYIDNAKPTLWEASVGFLIGGGVGIVSAVVLAHSRWLERAAMPWVIVLQVTPLIAYVPAIVIWRGFGFQSVVLVVAICCFTPFLVNGIVGLRSVDTSLLELARSVDASRVETLFQLRLPSALPNLFSAARIGVGMALMGAVLGEFFGGVTSGLGYAIKVAQSRGLTLQLWGSVFVLALIGSVAISLITLAERFVLHWHASQRS